MKRLRSSLAGLLPWTTSCNFCPCARPFPLHLQPRVGPIAAFESPSFKTAPSTTTRADESHITLGRIAKYHGASDFSAQHTTLDGKEAGASACEVALPA